MFQALDALTKTRVAFGDRNLTIVFFHEEANVFETWPRSTAARTRLFSLEPLVYLLFAEASLALTALDGVESDALAY